MRRATSALGLLLLATPSTACVAEAPQHADGAEAEGESGSDGSGSETETGAGELGYPEGPYGTEVGDVVENLSFVDGEGAPVELEGYHRGPQRALVLFGTAAWCGVCIAEAEELTITLSPMSDTVAALGVLYEDALGDEPTAEIVGGYNDALEAFEFVADPSQRFNDFFDPSGQLPRLLLIDTATMTLVYKSQGYDEEGLLAAIETIPAD